MSSLIYIRIGEELSDSELRVLGGKAYQQALAAADGLPVLEGLVLTTEAFPGLAWLEGQAQKPSDLQSLAVRDYLKNLGVDLEQAINELPGRSFAFRSSATSEDLESASFAGSFTTKLNVKADEIFLAVYQVWASTFSERVRRYLIDRGLKESWEKLKMAVLIQPIVPALLSGVGLSHALGKPQDPYVTLGIVRGLGEKLVGGEVTPQSFVLERGTWHIVEQDALDTQIVYECAAEIGRVIEFLELMRGTSQDIEFAIDSDYKFTLLQNRPIVSGTRSLNLKNGEKQL
jgi:pyruvate,water dikinase